MAISAQKGPPAICMVGSANTDLIVRSERMPGPGETVLGKEFHTGFGGKGANQAVMAARLGARVSVVVKLGRDQFGEGTLRNFAQQGIDTSYVGFDEERSSGVAPIIVEERTGENRIIVVPGANGSLSPADVRGAAPAIQGADVLLCQLETPLPATIEAFRLARESEGTMTVLNPAPAAELPAELLGLTDLLVPNESEAQALSDLPVATIDEAVEAARALQGRGPRNVVITLGEKGAVGVTQEGSRFYIEAQMVEPVDTTGAGDAFVGSLAYFLGSGRTLRDSVELASRIATRTVLKHGTQSSYPYREELAELF